jgi:hypothetical protein
LVKLFLGRFNHRVKHEGGGIVDQNIDVAEPGDRVSEEAADFGDSAHVSLNCYGLPTRDSIIPTTCLACSALCE